MLNGGIKPSGYLDFYNTLENTITISEGGNSCGYVSYNKEKFWCGGHCYSLNNVCIDTNYLFHNLKYNQTKIMKLRIGTGLPNIQKKHLESYTLNIHNLDDQLILGKMFEKIYSRIKLEDKKQLFIIDLKKGLLQQMFI